MKMPHDAEIRFFLLVFETGIDYYPPFLIRPLKRSRGKKMKNDFATKADLRETAKGLHQEIAAVKTELQQEIVSVKTELRQEINAVGTELHQEITEAKTELHEEIASVRTDLKTTTDRLQREIELVAVHVVQVSNDLKEFKQDTRERFDGVMTAIDGLAGLITDRKVEEAAVNHALRRHDHTLENHETRIGLLEKGHGSSV
jgi:archaellum component FlaC